MATTIKQQVALDEALVPNTKRLRIGKSNFRLPSDIQSKKSTLQVVYDVLHSCPFFKAKIESKHPYTSCVPLKSRKHRSSKRELPMKLQPYGNWSRELTDNVV
nr:hypothetical protein [Tanacetum cinerariifolium]